MLAVAATSADLLVDVGSKVSAYSLCDGRLLRTWTLKGSPAAVTSAGLFPVGGTVWAYTDWATDSSGFEYAIRLPVRPVVPGGARRQRE